MRNYLKVLDELDKKIAANPLDKSLTLAKDRLGKSSLTDAISKRIDQLNQLEPDPTFNRATALRYGPKGLAGSINYIVDDDNLYQGVMADNGFSTMEFIDKNDKRRDTFNYYKDNNSLIQQTDNIPPARMQNKFNREYKDSVSDSEIRAKNKRDSLFTTLNEPQLSKQINDIDTGIQQIPTLNTNILSSNGGQNNLLPTPNNRQVDKRITIAPLETPAKEVTSLSRNPTLNAIAAGMDKKKVDTTSIDEDGVFDIGKAGTFIKGIAPTIFSAIDAFTTKDNVNAYQDYGRDGLETLDTAKRDLNISLNQGKNDITNQIAGAKLANNNSTRSLNVARALNLSSDLVGQDAQNKLAAQTTDRRINLDTVIANAENQRDSVVMKGADEKQVRDAEDRSKIISNFSGAAQAIGSSKEHIGKMVNEGNYNDDFLSTLGALFPNMNIGKDAKGNLTFTRKKAVG